MTKLLRETFHWKFVFYELLLPLLQLFGPSRCDAVLCWLGKTSARLWPGRRALLIHALDQAKAVLGSRAAWDSEALWPELAAGTARFRARDYPLDARPRTHALSLFDVSGEDRLRTALLQDRGVILLGNHMGAYLAGMHWLYRNGLPIHSMVQKPSHVSRTLTKLFDEAHPSGSAADFFLQRRPTPDQAISLMLRARSLLRDRKIIYLCGDIPWLGANTRRGSLLGHEHQFLSVWTDLAVLSKTPVFQVFCSHLPNGRFQLDFEEFGTIAAGEEDQAVTRYLARLESQIAAQPDQAVAHLLWPCYQTPAVEPTSRRIALGLQTDPAQKANPRFSRQKRKATRRP